MTELDDSKLVGEIEISPMASFATNMSDIISVDEDVETPVDDVETPVDDVETPADDVEAPAEDPIEDLVQEKEEEEVVDTPQTSQASIAARILEQRIPGIFGEDIDSKMDWEALINNLEDNIEKRIDSNKEAVLNSAGQAKQYVDFLLGGGSPKILERALENVQYSKLDIEQSSDEEKEMAITAMYTDMGLTSEIPGLIEAIKLSNKLPDKTAGAVQYWDKKEKDILHNAKVQQDREDRETDRQRTSVTESMNSIIDSGNLGSMEIDTTQQTKLKDFLMNPTEIVEVSDNRGGTSLKKFTKYQKAEAEFKKSIEQQLIFANLLMGGLDLSKIKQQGKREGDENLMDLLNNQTTKKRTKSVNRYLNS